MRFLLFLLLISTPAFAKEKKILFIGNSFTFGATSSVIKYNAQSINDLNKQNMGGVPAIFSNFSKQTGYKYTIYMETIAGSGLDEHYNNKRSILNKNWDIVIMQTYSTLDKNSPNNSAQLIEYSNKFADLFTKQNPNVAIYLTATWPRADLVYIKKSPWLGRGLAAMTSDISNAYQKAALNPKIKAVIPVGEGWMQAFDSGVADSNPYDGIEYGKMALWGWDNYHASNYGYYLEALIVFGKITGQDVTIMGKDEISAFELGIAPSQAVELQKIAQETLKNLR